MDKYQLSPFLWKQKSLLWIIVVLLALVQIYGASSAAGNNADIEDQLLTSLATVAAEMCPVDMTAYWHLDEVGSAIYTDAQGGHHGQCSGDCPTPVSGQVGGGQLFNGSSTRISIPADPLFDWAADDNFSIEFWMKGVAGVSCTGTNSEVAVGRDDGAPGGLQWWLGCDRTTRQARFQLVDNSGDGSGLVLRGGPEINDGQWHHIVGVRDGMTSESRLYVNGTLVSSLVYTYTAGFGHATAPIGIGWINRSPFFHFQGTLDEVAIHNRSLSAEEIEERYDVSLAGEPYCTAPDVVPEIVSEPVTMTVVDYLYTYDIDAIGHPLPTYDLVTSPAGMDIDETTGFLSWLPTTTGSYSVTVQASNSAGIDQQPFGLEVIEAAMCPVDMTAYWKLDEVGSAVYTDAQGGYHGQCSGDCPTPAAGQVNGAQVFNGSSTGIRVPANAAFDWGANDSFSIEFWMKGVAGQTCTGARSEVGVGRDDGVSGGLQWWLGCDQETRQARFQLADSSGNGNNQLLRGGPQINDGQWHHIVGVRDGTANESRLYVNGTLVSSLVYTYTAGFGHATAPISIGWINLSPFFRFRGTLDEVAIHNYNLSPTEVQQRYTLGLAGEAACIVDDTPPEILSEPVTIAGVDRQYEYDVDAVGFPAPVYALTTSPVGMNINETTGLITWTPVVTGTYAVTVTASNVAGQDSQGFTIDVWRAPTITSTPVLTATVNEPYSYQVTAVGDLTLVYALTDSPAGMSIHETTGLITWTPVSSGPINVTVVASNAVGDDSQSFTIEVWQEAAITSTPATTATVGEPYSYQVTATGHPAPIYALTTSPAGMSINETTGLITWTPGNPGPVNVTVRASNTAGEHSQSFTIEVRQKPTITSTPVTTAVVGEPYSYQVTAVGDDPIDYALTTSPAGMSINETTGLITWTPGSPGPVNVTVQVSNAAGEDSQSFTVEVRLKPTITSTPVTTAVVGDAYTYQVAATGHPAPLYALTTSPAGMSINETTGLISWTPASPGPVNVTVRASNAAGEDSQSFTVEVRQKPTITSTPVTTAVVGEPYSYQVTAVGNPAPVYALSTGPTGMSINATTGLISWTPTSLGTFNVTVQAGNDAGTAEQSFTIIVGGALPPTGHRLFLPVVIGN